MGKDPYAMVGKDTRKYVKSVVDSQGWTFEPPPGNGYPKLKCACGNHMKTVHKSPSDSNYLTNLQKWVERQPCYADEGD